MSPDLRRIMPSQVIILRACKRTALAFAIFPVSSPDPMPVFVGMPAYCPCPELLLENIVTSTIFGLGAGCSVIVGPSPDDRSEFFDQLSLWGRSPFVDLLLHLSYVLLDGFFTWSDDGFEAKWHAL